MDILMLLLRLLAELDSNPGLQDLWHYRLCHSHFLSSQTFPWGPLDSVTGSPHSLTSFTSIIQSILWHLPYADCIHPLTSENLALPGPLFNNNHLPPSTQRLRGFSFFLHNPMRDYFELNWVPTHSYSEILTPNT